MACVKWFAVLVAVCVCSDAVAGPPAEETVQGLYEGTWKDASGSAKAEVRVVALGKGAFKLLARRERDGKVERAEIDGTTDEESGAVEFAGEVDGTVWKAGYSDGAVQGTIGQEGSLKVRRVERKPPTLGRKPPKGAVVLLDGKDFARLERSGGRPWYLGAMDEHGWPVWEAPLVYVGPEDPKVWPTKENPLPKGWRVSGERRKVDEVIGIGKDGSIQVPRGGMQSQPTFEGDYDAHVEFRCNFRPQARSQGRGNSGVHLPNGQEIQVLDSFGMTTYEGGCCGGLYGKKNPDTMEPIPSLKGKKESAFNLAALPPLQWQTFDVEFRTKKDDERKGFLTVYHNGVKIHDKVETKAGKGRFRFQDHGNPVRYRNVWVLPLNDGDDDS